MHIYCICCRCRCCCCKFESEWQMMWRIIFHSISKQNIRKALQESEKPEKKKQMKEKKYSMKKHTHKMLIRYRMWRINSRRRRQRQTLSAQNARTKNAFDQHRELKSYANNIKLEIQMEIWRWTFGNTQQHCDAIAYPLKWFERNEKEPSSAAAAEAEKLQKWSYSINSSRAELTTNSICFILYLIREYLFFCSFARISSIRALYIYHFANVTYSKWESRPAQAEKERYEWIQFVSFRFNVDFNHWKAFKKKMLIHKRDVHVHAERTKSKRILSCNKNNNNLDSENLPSLFLSIKDNGMAS